MGLGKQSKVLNKSQIEMVSSYLRSKRNGLRNQTIFLLSVKSGLRSKEISQLSWKEVCNSNGEVDEYINLTNRSSKGKSGRVIPLHKDVRQNLIELLDDHKRFSGFNMDTSFIVRTERSPFTTSQTIVNMFQSWYRRLGLVGCSSHSGRRTFITETSKKISLVGGSLRDVQMMVGHSSLQTTQRYIESDSESQRKVVDLI
ncbi:tyrosine-type recombinase/integrase [Alphaproteobacteria bacterium LSUCC0719]